MFAEWLGELLVMSLVVVALLSLIILHSNNVLQWDLRKLRSVKDSQ